MTTKPEIGKQQFIPRGPSRHRGHTTTLTEYNAPAEEVRYECSCGEGWWVAWDPDGDLGSDEAPEG